MSYTTRGSVSFEPCGASDALTASTAVHRSLFALIQARASAIEERRGGAERLRQLLDGHSGRVVEVGAGRATAATECEAATTGLPGDAAVEDGPNAWPAVILDTDCLIADGAEWLGDGAGRQGTGAVLPWWGVIATVPTPRGPGSRASCCLLW
jgi:hypothetical protein